MPLLPLRMIAGGTTISIRTRTPSLLTQPNH
jgi:hypothetical protein